MSNKKKTDEVISNVKLLCKKWMWPGFKNSCDRILSFQNCNNFFGPNQPCDCFEIQELDIRDRELEKINQMIQQTEDPTSLEKEEIEIKISDSEEPPLINKPKKKRKRRKKPIEDID